MWDNLLIDLNSIDQISGLDILKMIYIVGLLSLSFPSLLFCFSYPCSFSSLDFRFIIYAKLIALGIFCPTPTIRTDDFSTSISLHFSSRSESFPERALILVGSIRSIMGTGTYWNCISCLVVISFSSFFFPLPFSLKGWECCCFCGLPLDCDCCYYFSLIFLCAFYIFFCFLLGGWFMVL